jgi:aminopeptidase N
LERPHPSYLVTLVAGQFSVLEDRAAELASGKRVPIRYYVPVGREADAWRGLADTPAMVELFSRLTGLEYPFESYSQVVVADFVFGGMENTTATTLYEHALLDERAAIDVDSRSLVAHELAHQWFGDTLTCRDWHEAWLNEGFATYFEHVEREARRGRNEYDWSVLRDLESYLDEFNQSYDRPIVCREYRAPIDLFDRHLYEKGSLVLHMLRRRLGDSVFWSAIREYVKEHENRVVETGQLVRVCEQLSGQALDRFFDDWIYRSGHPELTVSANYESGRLEITVRQEPKGGRTDPFHLTLELRIQVADGSWVSISRESHATTEVFVLPLDRRPLAIAFDPELRIAAPIKLELGFDWLKNLLLSDVSLRSRLLAATALGLRRDEPSSRVLRDVLCDDAQPYPLGIECARALGKIRAPETVAHLTAAVGAHRAEVRRAVAAALGQFREPAVVAPLTTLADDASYLVAAEACRSLGRCRQPEARDILLSKLRLSSWADALRSGAVDGLAALKQPDLIPTLLEETRYGTPTRGRRAAVLALGRLATDRATREQLELLLDDHDPHVRSDVVDALVSLDQEQAMSRLSEQLQREGDTRVQRRLREALRDLGAKDNGAVKRLSDELTSVKSKLSELEVQVARLAPTSESPLDKAGDRSASGRGPRKPKTAAVKTKSSSAKASKRSARREPNAARNQAPSGKRVAGVGAKKPARKGTAAKAKSKTSRSR